MAKQSLQKKLGRVRPPRVHITYDVETDGGMVVTELPFVLGVLGDYSGNPDQPLPPVKERELVQIDRDNFDTVLEKMAPRLAFRVDERLSGEKDRQINVELRMKDMDDFSPENVAQQIEPMRELMHVRDRLKNLLYRIDGNDVVDGFLQRVLDNTDDRRALAEQLGLNAEQAPDA